jgi:ribonuclease I
MYYLALTSVGSFCDQNKCDASRLKNRNLNLLTIHGFWPSTQDRTFFFMHEGVSVRPILLQQLQIQPVHIHSKRTIGNEQILAETDRPRHLVTRVEQTWILLYAHHEALLQFY